MTGKLRVTPEKLRTGSQQFQNSCSVVKNLTNSMLNIVSQLNSTWSGEAATGYYGKLRGLEPDMNKLYKMIKEHTDDLMEMANTYQQAENANKQTASALKTNQIV